jgi:hypothetical protein
MHRARPLRPGDSLQQDLTSLRHRAFARLGEMGSLHGCGPERRSHGGAHCWRPVLRRRHGWQAGGHHRRQVNSEAKRVRVRVRVRVHHAAGVAAAQPFAVDPEVQGRGLGRPAAGMRGVGEGSRVSGAGPGLPSRTNNRRSIHCSQGGHFRSSSDRAQSTHCRLSTRVAHRSQPVVWLVGLTDPLLIGIKIIE